MAFCHLIFPECNYGTASISWKYYPLCRESCYSYANIESCKYILEFVSRWHHEARKCTAYNNGLQSFKLLSLSKQSVTKMPEQIIW